MKILRKLISRKKEAKKNCDSNSYSCAVPLTNQLSLEKHVAQDAVSERRFKSHGKQSNNKMYFIVYLS